MLSFSEIAAMFYKITRRLIPRQTNFPTHHRTHLSTRKKVLTWASYGTEKTHGYVIQMFSRLPIVGWRKWLLSVLHIRDLPISFDGILTPRSNLLPENLKVSQIVKKFPEFYETRRFMTVFPKACHVPLSWVRPIQSIPSSNFLYIHFNIILPSTPRSSK